MSWPKTEFETLYELPSRNGLTRPSRVRGQGYKMINMGELFGHDRIGAIDMELVPMNDRELENMLVEKGDLLFARQSLVLSGAGKCSIVKETIDPTTFESHIIRVRLKKDRTDPKFFYYYFKSPICGMKSIVTQGVQAGIRGNDLKKLKVHLPDIIEQQRIAEILEQYDDLIENNRRRIQLLEESARLLYKEWFVHLRFPGHEHVKIIDGVPEGWVLGCIGDLTEVKSGFAFKSKDWLEEGNPVIKIKNITGNGNINFNGCQCVDDSVADKASKYELFSGDMLIAMTGATIGKIGLMPRMEKKYFLNQRVGKYFSKIKLNPIPLLFCISRSQHFNQSILNLAGGAAQPNISGRQIESIEIVIPEIKALEWFNEHVKPMFSQREILLEQNDKLVQARDILLPRLMNGELSV